MAKKIKIQRYQHVDIVKIPNDLMEKFHEANREKCEAHELMPRYSKSRSLCAQVKRTFSMGRSCVKSGIAICAIKAKC